VVNLLRRAPPPSHAVNNAEGPDKVFCALFSKKALLPCFACREAQKSL
jgi:hypothetical protein